MVLPAGAVALYETVHGSRAYGLHSARSDTDRKGIFAPAPRALLGFRGGPEQVEEGADRVFYDVRKFFRLAAACNPTVIEMLFTDPADHLLATPAARRLLAARQAFLSRQAADSFGRYGLAQLKRIRTHRRWLLDPPARKPERGDFGLPARSVLPKDQQGAAEALLADGRLHEDEVPPAFLDVLERERRHRNAVREWQQYQEWLQHRNPARAELERQHHYDTKHAMHLLRLLRMGVEILERGEVVVRRPDAGELRAVRAGALSYEALVQQAEALAARIEAAAPGSPLPVRPDEERLDALCEAVVRDAHSWRD